MPKPEGYRKAMRLMELAAKFSRPIITLLDTPGAYPGIDAEERGQAEAIAMNLREMSRLARAGDRGRNRRRRQRRRAGAGRRQSRLHAGERRLQRDLAGKLRRHHLSRRRAAPQAAAALKITAPDLLELGLIDGIVPEPPEERRTTTTRRLSSFVTQW